MNTNIRFGIDKFELRVRLARGHPDAPVNPQPWKYIDPEVFDNLPRIQMGKPKRPVQSRPLGRTHTPPLPAAPTYQNQGGDLMEHDDIDDEDDLENYVIGARQDIIGDNNDGDEEKSSSEAVASALGPTPKKFRKHIGAKNIQEQLAAVSQEGFSTEDHDNVQNQDQNQ